MLMFPRGGHFLLETHAEPAPSLLMEFIKRTQGERRRHLQRPAHVDPKILQPAMSADNRAAVDNKTSTFSRACGPCGTCAKLVSSR